MFISCARQRTIFGSTSCNPVSRFVEEIPKELLEGYNEFFGDTENRNAFGDSNYEWKYGSGSGFGYNADVNNYKVDKSTLKPKPEFSFRSAESFLQNLNKKPAGSNVDVSIYQAGQRVYHKKFGEGKINYVEPEGDDVKVDITFDKAGHKRLMAKFAGLEILD